ncbi:ribokinase [Clostridium omnivorum]|uniref:Ribokinase n=1 Tax=Clostridium omnivorum TaxID=1604902 RepID=A0ABQ5N7U8_9CLOT|nr:ribokinase [Clostridium sp. E14]GLC31318.1 ribokinase [Clostridium sp. E14]
MNRICVLGSMNMDIVLKVKNMPQVGETIMSKSMEKIAGGKGANQAVAAKRSGAEVYMIAKVGRDDNGMILTEELEKDNIDVRYVFKDDKEPTGMAIINVDDNGDNSIIVVSGANMAINSNEINSTEGAIEESNIVITQFETPMDMSIEAFKLAKKHDKLTILNPAPAREIDDELLKYTDIIIPNETEAALLTNIEVKDLDSGKRAAEEFFKKGVKCVIITLGEKGAAVITKENSEIVRAYKVEAIDTTAAGDSFIGALSSTIDAENLSFEDIKAAVRFGNKVSSIAVQRKGAQPSIPYLNEVLDIYKEA